MLSVTYVKSCIGYPEHQKRTLRTLGLKRLGDQVELPDTDVVAGMIRAISHLVDVSDARRQGQPSGSPAAQEEA